MANDSLDDFPEDHLSKELMRIRAELESSQPSEHRVDELFELLIRYSREFVGDSQLLDERVQRFSEQTIGSRIDHRLSILVEMLHDTQDQIRRRAISVTERLAALDVVQQANACYSEAAHRRAAIPLLRIWDYSS